MANPANTIILRKGGKNRITSRDNSILYVSMKITVVGIGYVGLSLATLLSEKNDVYLLDIDDNKVNSVNRRNSPINDSDIQFWLTTKTLKLTATMDSKLAYQNADFVIVATPTDYDPEKNFFNTATVEKVINDAIKHAPNATIIIKSTVLLDLLNYLSIK